MPWYEWFVLISLSICILNCIYHTYTVIKLGNPPEYARKAGHTGKAVRYSFTGAMSPKLKESAYLHMPTYTAGIIYHLGTFLAIILFFIILTNIPIAAWLTMGMAGWLIISVISGTAILIKRISKKELRSLSNPDDYISNILVTLFQLTTALVLLFNDTRMWYFTVTALLLLYFPLGKLKHAIYFFAARYHLGYFYGWRGVWPPKPVKK